MSLEGRKVAVLMEADYYEPEIWYYDRRFKEEGAEIHFLTRLWGQERLTFAGHEWKVPFEVDKSFEGMDDKNPDLAKIKAETTLTYRPPAGTEPSEGLPFKIKSAELASKNAGGTITFDPEKGRVEESTMKVEMSGKLNIEIGGQTTAVNLDQTQTTTVKTSDTNPIKK